MKTVFAKKVKYPSVTMVHTNGEVVIAIDPKQQPAYMHPGDFLVEQHGELVSFDDGEMVFTPDEPRVPGPPRYTIIGRTVHGEVKEYPKSVIVSFKFDRTNTGDKMVEKICEESMHIFGMLKKYNGID